MKKLISLIMILVLSMSLVTGCSDKKETVKVENTGDISYKSETISYGELIDDVSDSIKEDNKVEIINLEDADTLSIFDFEDSNKDLRLIVNGDGVIRAICLRTSDITTYDGVKIGDNRDDKLAKYQYTVQMGSFYSVLFDGNEEISAADSTNVTDDCMWINYLTDTDGVITTIYIYDHRFGSDMQ